MDKYNKQNEAALLHDATVSPRDDRFDRGKALRAAIPWTDHAGWNKPADRVDPLDLLEESNRGRLKELIPLRWGRMSVSPFTFFRGAAALMAADLKDTASTRVYVQACGDCHLLNFGAFATPERNIAFDLNDFDETLPAPWEWDLKRLAVSFVLASRENQLKAKFETGAVTALCSAYREKMAEYSKMSILDIWYDRIDWQHVIKNTDRDTLKNQRTQLLKKAQKRNSEYYFPKLVDKKQDGYIIKDAPPTIYHVDDFDGLQFKPAVQAALETYAASLQEDKRRLFSRYRFVDTAIKVVGVGSVGTTCVVILMLAPDDEPLFLQMKEARQSVLEPYAGKSAFENRGQRVVEGQRIIQSASDIFLGWTEFDNGKHFYIRQLRDTKIKLQPEFWDGDTMIEMAEIMGAVLAKAHARSGDSAVISGYLGKDDAEFDEAIADFALTYTNQVERDHALLAQAIKSGRIKAIIESDD